MYPIWCFWTVVLEKTLESPLDCKEIQPVHLKGEQSWVFIGGLMLKLKLQYFGDLIWRADSFEKTLMLGRIKGRRRRGWQRMRWLDGMTYSMGMDLGKLPTRELWGTGRPGVLQFMGSQRVRHDWVTELICFKLICFKLILASKTILPDAWMQKLVKAEVYPLQYSGLEISMDCIVYGVANSWRWLSDFHFTYPSGSGVCVPSVHKQSFHRHTAKFPTTSSAQFSN